MGKYSYGWKPQAFDHRRAKFALIPPKADRTKYVTLDPYLSAIKDQKQTGACTAFSFTSAHEAAGRIIGAPDVGQLSELDEYYSVRVAEGDCLAGQPCPDDGAMTDDSINVPIKRGGNTLEAAWPFDGNAAETPPASDGTASKHLWIDGFQPIASTAYVDGIIAAINNRQPGVFAFQVYNDWETDYENTAVFRLNPTSGIAGGHQVEYACYIPPDSKKPDTLPSGLIGIDNSWGKNSPPRPDIDPAPKAGRVYMHVETFSNMSIVNEACALVPKAQPAILTVTVTPPSSATVGQPSAWAAAVTGAPQGTVLDFAWVFSDGGTADGQNASYTPRAAGTLKAACVASVATTGASASGSASVTVQAAPTPSTNCAASAQAIVVTEYNKMIASYTAGRIDYAAASVAYQYLLETWTADGALSSSGLQASDFPAAPVRA